jgi:hypothetical protein
MPPSLSERQQSLLYHPSVPVPAHPCLSIPDFGFRAEKRYRRVMRQMDRDRHAFQNRPTGSWTYARAHGGKILGFDKGFPIELEPCSTHYEMYHN